MQREQRAAGHPLVISHRTNAGDAPENTLAGIAAAIRDHCDAVEVDVRATADGALVLMHDETLARTTGDARAVASVTLAEWRTLRVRDPYGRRPPQPAPTLDEALAAAVAGRCVLEIDLPERGLEARIVELVRAAHAEASTWFTTHPPEDAAFLRRACPAARVFLSVAPAPVWVTDLDEAIATAASLGLHGVNPSLDALTAGHVERAHARGLLVGAWTIDEPEAIARALDLGVDAITTNVPRRVFAAIEARAVR